MTASNEELTVKDFEYLKKSTPPQGGWFTPLTPAFEQLRIHNPSYLTDPKKGTELQLTSQDGEDSDLILMPHPLDISGNDANGVWYIGLYCDSQPTATVGETEVSLENVGVNSWKFSLPAGAYGDILVHENERVSIPRTLHRWRPQIKMDRTYTTFPFPFMHINTTFTLLARATMDTLSFRDSAWNDPPPAVFDARWDYDGSNVAWKIDGQGTDENDMFWQYNGSGLESLKALDAKDTFDAGNMYTLNGSTIAFQVCCSSLSFTYQFRAFDGSGGQDQYGDSLCGTIWDNNLITLSDDWSVAADSYKDTMGYLDPTNISWNAFQAEPPFDSENEPR
jgi:hypothetical protein